MPTQIDRCASCGHPVFQEEAVAGGCSCPERGLRLLLAAARQQNGGAASVPDPGFMPRFQAPAPTARQVVASRPAAPPPLRGRPRVAAVVDDATFFGEEDSGDWTGGWREPQEAPVAAAVSQMDLAAMWMQGTGIPYDPSQLVGTPGADDFEFSTGDIDVSAASRAAMPSGGGGGGRFRVDRPTPQRPSFDRTTVNNHGPMRETARVRDRFAVLREVQPAGPPPRMPPAQVQESFAPPEPVPVRLSAIQQARVLQASVKPGVSSYDRLRRNPFNEK